MKLVSLLSLALAPALVAAAPLTVDFSIPGRSDAIARGHQQWVGVDGASATKTLGGATFTLRAHDGRELATTWWKGGAVEGARMAVDAVMVSGSADGAALELRLSGLAPGMHTLATFHNVSAPPSSTARTAKFDVLVDGVVQIRGVQPSLRAENDDAAAATYLRFEAKARRDVVVLFRVTEGAGARGNIALCGLELDGSDPSRRAAGPVPLDGDEHAEADGGRIRLKWAAGRSAVSHRVYVGADRETVAAAMPESPENRGTTARASFDLNGLNTHADYYWRVDEVDAQGVVTKGRTWHFRPRHLAFPGAEGYGRFARGGRGGRVIEVTNLNDSGPGSLRAAVEADGPRTVIFNVSGIITLESKLVIRNPYITVAGQTAPGKGITLRKYNFGMMGAQDAIVRFVRVRPGNISGTTLDGMGMAASNHCIVDHASISWTLDEAFSSRAARNITLQRTMIAEALNEAGHKNYRPGSRHGYAASIGGMIGSFHHNLLAHNSGRNWSLAGGLDQAGRHTGWLDIRNNVVYNWDNRTTDGGAARVNYVNNYYKPGPASRVFHLLKPERNNIQGFGPQDYYVAGNIMEGHVAADNAWGGIVEPNPARVSRSGDAVLDHDDARPSRRESLASFVKQSPFFEPYVTTHTAAQAYKVVLSDVGCTLPVLDDHDVRIIRETRDGTFTYKGSKTNFPGLPDSQQDVGGWEQHPEERRPVSFDRDHDGLPDWWETLNGLDRNSPAGSYADSNADLDRDGYTNLEDYLNWLAQPHVECEAGNSVEVDLAALTRGFTAKPVHAVSSAANGRAVLAADGHTVRFTPTPGFSGLARLTFTVTDAEGDSLARTVGIAVKKG